MNERIEALQDAATKALIAYGYDRLQAHEAVRRALKNFPNASSVEELVKLSLTHV